MITDMSSLLQEDTTHVVVVFLGDNGKKQRMLTLFHAHGSQQAIEKLSATTQMNPNTHF